MSSYHPRSTSRYPRQSDFVGKPAVFHATRLGIMATRIGPTEYVEADVTEVHSSGARYRYRAVRFMWSRVRDELARNIGNDIPAVRSPHHPRHWAE